MSPLEKFTRDDVEKLLTLAVFWPVSWLVPERYWPPFCRFIARATGVLMPGRRRASDERVPAYLTELAGTGRESFNTRVIAGWHREMLEVLKDYAPGGWRPVVDLHGQENLDDALNRGHGAILWVADFESASLVAKIALAQAGRRASHLSRPDHGFSPSPFGIRFLNPVRTRVEDRYIAERLTMKSGKEGTTLRTLRQRLSQNQLVSISVLFERGAQTTTLRMFGDEFRLPTGPITLARAAKASLLPVFVLRRGPGSFDVTIEAPLDIPAERNYEAPASQYAQLLERYVRRDPVGWRSWQHL